jgi:hypothetical protein
MYVGLSSIEIETHKHSPDKEEKWQESQRLKQNRMAVGRKQPSNKDLEE